MSTEAPERAPTGHPPVGEVVMAGGLALLGVAVIVGASQISVPSSSHGLGPQVFPYAAGIMLLVTSLALLVQLRRGKAGAADDGEDIDTRIRPDARVVIAIVVAIALAAVLIPVIGWPVSAALLFLGCAVALGTTSLVRAGLIGLALGLVIQILFGNLLGLTLPAGPVLDSMWLFRG